MSAIYVNIHSVTQAATLSTVDQIDAYLSEHETIKPFRMFLVNLVNSNTVTLCDTTTAKRLFNSGNTVHHLIDDRDMTLIEYSNECVRQGQKGLGRVVLYPTMKVNANG